MPILTSKEGKFYEVPEDVLKKHEVPQQKVKEILADLDSEMDAPEGPAGPTVVIHVSGSGAYVEPGGGEPEGDDVEPYGYYGHHWDYYYPPYWYHRRRRRRRRHHYYY